MPAQGFCAALVVIGGVLFQDTAQVRLAEHDHVIEAFTTN
jgi:hypothetical protein